MIKSVKVDFEASEVAKVRLFGKIPQFFDKALRPVQPANEFLRAKAKVLAPKSVETLAEHTREFLSWVFGTGLELSDLDEDYFESYVEALCHYKKSNGQSLAWNTVNARVTGACQFLTWCISKGYCPHLTRDEVSLIKDSTKALYKARSYVSKPIQRPVKFLNEDEALKFVSALGKISGRNNAHVRHRNILVGQMMLQTGLRVSEVCDFPLRDLPEVESNFLLTPARCAFGKGAKSRMILIPNELLLRLWEYVDIDRERITERFSGIAEEIVSPKLFVSEKGTPLSVNWVEKLFRKASKYTGINAHPHTLRHTFGTYHYLYNRDLITLSKLLGHSDSETTKRLYVGLAGKIEYASTYRDWNQKIDRYVEAIYD